MTSLVWFMVLGLAASVSGRTEPQPSQEKNIFILAGQSNMAGRGHEVCGYECMPRPNILRFSAALNWEPAKDNLHQDIDLGKSQGVGPGMPFANRILERNPNYGVIGLVPCAIGQTQLDRWKKGEKLYNNMIARAKASLRDGGEIRALLWYQGESDSNLPSTATYAERFKQMVSDIRSDLQIPTLPVIQVAIRKKLDEPDIDVRQQQLGTKYPNVTTVDAKGSAFTAWDEIHLNTAGNIHVGRLIADGFLDNYA